jgi:hypothetical protein
MGKLERWAVVAEIVAAVAVVASLVHLSFEVKRNTSAVRSQTSQGLLELSNEANLQIVSNPGFADLFLRANENLAGLNEIERLQYRRHINSELNIWEHAFYSHENGTMDERLWRADDVSYRAVYCEDASNVIWQEIETFYGEEFRRHVNATTSADCTQTSF